MSVQKRNYDPPSVNEETSPFFLKRRIRSSNPHARTKRAPLISKAFFKKQTRDGIRKKQEQLISENDSFGLPS